MLLPSSPSICLDRIIRKTYWHILPILILCFIISIIVKNNVIFAKFNMADDLPSFHQNIDTILGFAQAAFSVGYILVEIPGTLIVERWSARKWFCIITIGWGVTEALTAFVKEQWQFYILRFLLGLLEGSLYPGVIIYFTYWFPSKARAKALSFFFLSLPISQLLNPKFCYYFLRMGTTQDGVYYSTLFKLKGWQWLYIACGILSILVGIILGFILPDRPSDESWLSDEERQLLENKLTEEKTEHSTFDGYLILSESMPKTKVALLSVAFFLVSNVSHGIDTFMPTMLMDWYKMNASLLTWILIIPPIGILVSLLLNGWHSDRTNERRMHTAIPIIIGSVGLSLTLIRPQPLSTMIILFTIILSGIRSAQPAFWSLTSLLLNESIAATSIGLINSAGNLAGTIGPVLLGISKDHFGSFDYAIIALVVSSSLSALIFIVFPFNE